MRVYAPYGTDLPPLCRARTPPPAIHESPRDALVAAVPGTPHMLPIYYIG